MSKYVGYYRVSTQAQGRSGLGLESQKNAVLSYLSSVRGTLAAEFSEVESGASRDRRELERALECCRTNRAVLVIARLDRLARNLYFISKLMESGVEFVAADMPAANKFTVQIIGAMAEYERDLISERTKSALSAAKARGVKLGNPSLRDAARLGAIRNRELADDFAERLRPIISSHISVGFSSYASIARALNALGVQTQRGKKWTTAGACNIIRRLNASSTVQCQQAPELKCDSLD